MASTVPNTSASSATGRGTIQLLIGRLLLVLAGYVIAVVLARGLGPAAYGVYGFIMALLVWLETSGDFGIKQAVTKLIPAAERPATVETAGVALLLAVTLVLFVTGWILAPAVARMFDIEGGERLLRIALLDVPANGLYLAYQGILMGHRRFATVSMMLVVYSLTKVGGILVLLTIGLSIEGALIVNVLATVGALLFLFTQHRVSLRLPPGPMIRTIVSIAVPVGLAIATMQLILTIHLWLLKRLAGASDVVVGHYVAALNVATLPRLVPFVLTGVVLASVSWALARADRALAAQYVRSALRFVIVLLVPTCVLGAQHATPIMELIFSAEYARGAVFLAWLLAAFGLYAMFETLMHALIGAGRYYRVIAALAGIAVMAAASSALLIARMGPEGAAAGLALAVVGALGIALALAQREFGMPVQLGTLLRAAAATAAVAYLATLFEMSGLWLIVKLGLLMAVYLLLLAALRELGPRDLKPLAVWKTN